MKRLLLAIVAGFAIWKLTQRTLNEDTRWYL